MKRNEAERNSSKDKEETYNRRRVVARVRPLPVPPLLLRHLEVGDFVNHSRDFSRRHSLRAQPARVAVSARPEDRMRAALEREDPALHKGDEKVGGHEPLRLLEHSESADGGRRVRRHRLRFVLPGSASSGGGPAS